MPSAPVQGHTTPHSMRIWMLFRDVKDVDCWLENGEKKIRPQVQNGHRINWKTQSHYLADFVRLEPATEYVLHVSTDGAEIPQTWRFRTLATETPASYSFMTGSCAMYNTGLLSLSRPGRFTKIYDEMRKVPTDFFLWTGDNVYLLLGEWKKEARMYKKYTTVRLDKRINAFLTSRPQYAILDDHDYGPDNGDATFDNKNATSTCFRDFWPNPDNDAGVLGNFSQFRHYDSHFFLLDDRYHRIKDGHEAFLGEKQLAWLKRHLKASDATFKFIAVGSQVLSEVNQHESYFYYEERQELFDFIRNERIEGVVFLTGDRHFTELLKAEREGLYPLYDFTCSPLTSIVRKKPLKADDPEHVNPLRVEGTMLCAHNFGTVTVEGPLEDRVAKLQVYDAFGKPVWEYVIRARSLRFSEP